MSGEDVMLWCEEKNNWSKTYSAKHEEVHTLTNIKVDGYQLMSHSDYNPPIIIILHHDDKTPYMYCECDLVACFTDIETA